MPRSVTLANVHKKTFRIVLSSPICSSPSLSNLSLTRPAAMVKLALALLLLLAMAALASIAACIDLDLGFLALGGADAGAGGSAAAQLPLSISLPHGARPRPWAPRQGPLFFLLQIRGPSSSCSSKYALRENNSYICSGI
jgi:hypothetical protein